MFESVLEAGLTAAGVDALLLGPMPTPAVACLTRTLRATAGIVISASHNPYSDNGIKFFTADGGKLSDDVELAIEAAIDSKMRTVGSTDIGKAVRIDDARGTIHRVLQEHGPPRPDAQGVEDCRRLAPTARRITSHRTSSRSSAQRSFRLGVPPTG